MYEIQTANAYPTCRDAALACSAAAASGGVEGPAGPAALVPARA